ncbi:sugar transferase [Brachybacterium avium]|uniref:sugar transferase n=1 Tax=Brachybacterium avium TaxID=2017485 RepID=UPI001FE9F70C|nr:sugar transferase [Brachybacterium avium]
MNAAGPSIPLFGDRHPLRVPVRPAKSRRTDRRDDRLLVSAIVAADLLALALACVVALVIRQNLAFLDSAPNLPESVLRSAAVIALAWMFALRFSGATNPRLVSAGPEIYRNVLMGSLGAVGIIGAVLFLTDYPLSRPFFVTLFLAGPLFLLLVRVITRRCVNLARTRGHLRSQVLVVGSTGHVRGIVRTLTREVWLGYDVVGAIAPISDERREEDAGVPILGDESQLLDLVRAESPDIVLFTAGSSASAEEFRRVAWELEGLEVGVIVVPAVSEISGDRIRMRPVAGLPLVHMDLPRSRKALKKGKRLFDIAASALLLLMLSPILAVVALCVHLGDGGGVVFRQQRVGRTGQPFEFLKFRSMVMDAEARRAELEQLARDRGNDVLFKMSDDPRITRVGKFLRRYSLDELPQLWNVLRGDMSLVGPRPALPQEVSGYDGDAHRRLAVRPGITGLWQVSGRSDLSWDDTVRLDLFYVDNWSFMQDLLILVRTARAVLASRGAY